MDAIVFYQPPSASTSQSPHLPGARTSSNISGGPIAPFPQPTLQLENRNTQDTMTKFQGISGLSQQCHASDQCHGNDTIQVQDLTATQHPADSDDEDDFPDIDELLSGIMQKNKSAGANPNGDGDDSFRDIDELLSGIKEKSFSASADTNSGGMAKIAEGGTRGGSPADSNPSTVGSAQDPIILSDDESVGDESETDYCDLDVDLIAKSDSDSPQVANSGLADGDGFAFRTARTPGRLVTNHQDGDDTHNNGIVDNTRLWLSAERSRPASPGRGSVTHQPSKLWVNTEIPQGSTSSMNLDATTELEGGGFDVSAEGHEHDDDDTRSVKTPRLWAVSDKHPAFESSISGRQDGQPDDAQSPHPGPAAASGHRSDLKNDNPPKQRRRRDATTSFCRKRPRTTAPSGPARTTSATLEPVNVRQLRTRITAADQEMDNDGSVDDSEDGDYDDKSAAPSSERGRQPRSRKRVRRTTDTEDDDVETPPTPSFGVSGEAGAATLAGSIQESDEIPIHGFFTLKTIGSKVVYCLTFSQELLLRPQHQRQKQDGATVIEEPKSVPPDSGIHQAPPRRQTTRHPFTGEENATLRKMKKEGHSWDEIHAALPHRSKGALQVHYSTKLKGRR